VDCHFPGVGTLRVTNGGSPLPLLNLECRGNSAPGVKLEKLRGELIGINTAILAPGGGNIGIGFAVPISIARRVAPPPDCDAASPGTLGTQLGRQLELNGRRSRATLAREEPRRSGRSTSHGNVPLQQVRVS
jgi:S1-C subfamily serine protease